MFKSSLSSFFVHGSAVCDNCGRLYRDHTKRYSSAGVADSMTDRDCPATQSNRIQPEPKKDILRTDLKPNQLEISRPSDRQEGGDHYLKMGIQPWDIIKTWPLEQQIGFFRGNALKYILRIGSKDDALQEAKKAKHYIEQLIEILEKVK